MLHQPAVDEHADDHAKVGGETQPELPGCRYRVRPVVEELAIFLLERGVGVEGRDDLHVIAIHTGRRSENHSQEETKQHVSNLHAGKRHNHGPYDGFLVKLDSLGEGEFMLGLSGLGSLG